MGLRLGEAGRGQSHRGLRGSGAISAVWHRGYDTEHVDATEDAGRQRGEGEQEAAKAALQPPLPGLRFKSGGSTECRWLRGCFVLRMYIHTDVHIRCLPAADVTGWSCVS
jgi:hypothetical protein